MSGVSRYFAKLLADTDVVPEPWQRPVIMLEESVLGPDLKDILAYAYTGSATVGQARLPHFLKTACKLQVSLSPSTSSILNLWPLLLMLFSYTIRLGI